MLLAGLGLHISLRLSLVSFSLSISYILLFCLGLFIDSVVIGELVNAGISYRIGLRILRTTTMDTISEHTSPSSAGSPPASAEEKTVKRTATDAGLNNGLRPAKSVKRRASKACQCCRARKVRCNVVEHGAPCTNCRLDQVECIVSESKRKK